MNQQHNISHKQRRPLPPTIRLLLSGLCLGVVFFFNLTQSAAATPPAACGASEAGCQLQANFSAVSSSNTLPGITAVNSSAFGSLIYPDFIEIEQLARAALRRGLIMRESISPYRDDNDFDTFTNHLDTEAGFSTVYTPTTPYDSGLTLNAIVDNVEADLTEARDLYAYLLVFAPNYRFRADAAYISTVPSGYPKALCDPALPENPNPPDPNFTGQVLPPVVDWCDFQSRLRQSVREAANMRLIFGQEFMVDALGVNFSGGFIGGEVFVVTEVAKLRAAQHQFELAEQFLASALKRSTGSGCLVSDFYQQPEWALLSKAADLQGNANYHIASRLSYLGVGSPQGVPIAQAAAQGEFRQAANDGYIKLIGIAGLGDDNSAHAASGCTAGERPDGDLVANMATNLLETRRQSSEMADGRNVFGFDVTMTPARKYKSSLPLNCDTNAGERGLWDQAKCSANIAVTFQDRAENTSRDFDTSQAALRTTVQQIFNHPEFGLDNLIYNTTGCDRGVFATDALWYVCIETQSAAIETCLNQAHLATFDSCMNSVNTGTDGRSGLFELRAIYLEYKAIETSMINIDARIQNSNDANATVTDWLLAAGTAETVSRASAAALDAVSCIDFSDLGSGTGQSTAACVVAGVANGLAQAAAGALSQEADVEIADAQNKMEIENLLLDQSELLIQAQAAHQAYFSKKSDVQGMLDNLNRNRREAERQRAHFAALPANDPSFRIVRDSARLQLADKLEEAAQLAYLAARRAEYEYADSLARYNFRISDIYRARTAQDIIDFLDDLVGATSSMAGAANADNDPYSLPTISVARHVLQLTDAVLISEGFTTPSAIEAERTARFRAWVADNTKPNPSDPGDILYFSMATSLVRGGVFSNLILQGYDTLWRLQLSGPGVPYAQNTGVSVNLVTDQTDSELTYRSITVDHGGLVHLRSQGGCFFDYRLVAPSVMLGTSLPSGQNAESQVSTFSANVNDSHLYTEKNFRTGAFEGRPISATDWQFTIRDGHLTDDTLDMDLQQLTDIELNFSAVRSSRNDVPVDPVDCVRIDW